MAEKDPKNAVEGEGARKDTPGDKSKAGQEEQGEKWAMDQKSFDIGYERAARKAAKELAASLGYDDPDKLKEAIEASKKREREQAEAQGNFSKLYEDEKAKREKAESDAKKISADAEARYLKASFIAAAAGKVVDPDAAHKLVDLSGVKIDEKGDPIGLDAIVDGLLKDKPYLKAGKNQSAIGSGTAPAPGSESGAIDVSKLTADEFEKFRQEQLARA